MQGGEAIAGPPLRSLMSKAVAVEDQGTCCFFVVVVLFLFGFFLLFFLMIQHSRDHIVDIVSTIVDKVSTV